MNVNREMLKENSKVTSKVVYCKTHPIDSTIGWVDIFERNTWHAKRGSNGCFVINPKYLNK